MGHFLRFSGLTTSPERRISKFKWSPLIFNSQWECEVVWKKITHRWHRAGRKVRSEFLVFTGCSLWSSVNVVLRILSLAVIHVHLYFILYSEMVFLKNRKVLLKRWERVKKNPTRSQIPCISLLFTKRVKSMKCHFGRCVKRNGPTFTSQPGEPFTFE